MIEWLIEALVASTVLMVAVLLLRGPLRKTFGADIAYALWALPVLRLLLPPLPGEWHEAAIAPVLRVTEPATILFVDSVGENAAAAAPGMSWLAPAIALLWATGAVGFIVWHGLAHRRFYRRMLSNEASRVEVGGVHVIETDAASGPLAFGIWRRYVAFPRDFAERYEPEERDLALAHELGHHARGDLIANWVALVVLALHWFNPVAWRAFRAFRADQEIANDARVLAGMNPMRRHTYACAIVKAAHPKILGGAVSAACHLHTIDELKGRLRMLTTDKKPRGQVLVGAGALVLLGAAGLGLTASGVATATTVRTTVESATGLGLASLDQTPPLPPAPPVSVSPVATPAPAAPPQIVTDEMPGAPVKHEGTRVVIIRSADMTAGERAAAKEGKSITKHRMVITMPGDPAQIIEMQEMPAISDGKCGIGVGKPAMMVFDGKDGEKRKMIICTDRIQKIAADGAAIAANGNAVERNAYVRALEGLRTARARTLSSTDLGADERTHALEGIDIAIREIESDLAKVQ